LLLYGLTGFLRLSRDAGCLRDSLTSGQEANWDKKFQASIGPITANLVRGGLSYVEMDHDARTALRVVRGAEVGIYQWQGRERLNRGSMLAAADEAMERRGWERLVGVLKDGDFVAVYVPKDVGNSRMVKACLAVFNGHELIVASVRSDLDPLLELAFNQAESKASLWRELRLSIL
jgi:hypothetical protein